MQLRKNNKALVYGKYTLLDKNNKNIYAYTRELDGKKFLIALNFTKEPAAFNAGINMTKAKLLLSNYSAPSARLKLKPYEAVVYEIK